MATTYVEAPFNDGPWGRAYSDLFTWRCAARQYANGDVVKLRQLDQAVKLGDSVVANNEVDSNATPTLTGVLELAHATDATSPIPIVSVAAATLGVDDGVTRTNNIEGLGYVTRTNGWWLQFRFTAANATPKSEIMAFAVNMTGQCFAGEDAGAPTG